MEIRVFVSSLSAYNSGILTGKWTTLPVNDVQKDILDGLDGEEYFISDYDAPFEIGEHINLVNLNELARELIAFDTIKDLYCSIDNKQNVPVPDVYPFDEEFFEEQFEYPSDAAKAVMFGNVKNWGDKYIYFDENGYLQSMNEYGFEKSINEYADKFIKQFILENNLNDIWKANLYDAVG